MKHYFCLFFVLLFATEPLLAINPDDTTTVSEQSGSAEGQDEPKQPQTWLEYCYKNRDYVMIGAGVLLMAAGCAYFYYTKKAVPGITMESVTDQTNPLAGEGVTNPVSAKSAEFDYPKHYGPKSRALVDELRNIHPIIFDKICNICNKEYEYPWYCDLAVTKLEEMKQAGKKDYGSLQQIAGWVLNKSVLDPVDRLNAKKEIDQNLGALLDKKFAPQVPVQETVATPQVSGDDTLKSDEMYPLLLALFGS